MKVLTVIQFGPLYKLFYVFEIVVSMVFIRTSDCTASQHAYARRGLLTGPSKNTAQLLRSAEGQKLLTELRADLAADLMSPVGGCWGDGRNLVSCDKFVVLKLGWGGLLCPQRYRALPCLYVRR